MKRTRIASALTFLLGLLMAVPSLGVGTPAVAGGPAPQYATHFGEGNIPAGCEEDVRVGELDLEIFGTNPGESADNTCFQMRTGLNRLDSPQIDVLVMVPISPTAERDMRIMRQSVEMWEGGIATLARRMGLSWLERGVDFHITVDHFDPVGGNGGEFTTYPIVDPEIVVIATNPVGGIGIGFDPFGERPCHAFPVRNPLDHSAWEALPGFDSHHGKRSGTYTEDCKEEGGGNVCFAINGAIDPVPGAFDIFGLFDLVSHEVGHCLTVGHVGDGAEGAWRSVPRNDVMAYATTRGRTKCVSTLDVESFALRMSRYLDVDGDGKVGGEFDSEDDLLSANDPLGEGGSAFQMQHPRDHFYASRSGFASDCPQPDLGVVPAKRTDWTPDS